MYSLLCQLCLVLLLDADFLQGAKFLDLDAFDLQTLIFKALTHLASFFKIVKTILFANLLIVSNLVPDGLGVVSQVGFLLLVDEALFFFGALVLFNDAEEGVTLEFGLLAEHFFALHELAFARDVEILGLTAFLLGFCNLLCTLIALVLFKCTFLSECINFCLSVSSTLLKVTEAFYFLLLFFLELFLLSHLVFDLCTFLSFISNDLQVFILLLADLLGFLIECDIVGLFNLSHHLLVAHLFLFDKNCVGNFHLLNVLKHLRLFLFEELTLLDAFLFTLGDLIDDNLCTGFTGTCAAGVALFLLLERFETFDLHHKVKFLLF